jgi:hypothetical protein
MAELEEHSAHSMRSFKERPAFAGLEAFFIALSAALLKVRRTAPRGSQSWSSNAQRAHFIPSGPRWIPMILPWTRTSPKS